MFRSRLVTLALAAAWAAPSAAADDVPAPTDEQAAAFARTMSDATLVGAFTVDGMPQQVKQERYRMGAVKRVRDDMFQFETRIQYGGKDVPVPSLYLPVKWAGDTPVITVEKVTIPGMGTFSARVLVHGDRYVGSWQHDQVGGHMFGRIYPKGAELPDDATKAAVRAIDETRLRDQRQVRDPEAELDEPDAGDPGTVEKPTAGLQP